MEKDYIDMRDLAVLMCLEYNTVRAYKSKHPELLPPSLPKRGRPLWKRTEVIDWVEHKSTASAI